MHELRLVPCAIALALCASCTRTHVAEPAPSTIGAAPRPVAAAGPAAPASRPADNLLLRPTVEWLAILELQQRYLATEGPSHRGPAFAQLALALNQLMVPTFKIGVWGMGRMPLHSISEVEVLAVLGPPDFGGSNQGGSELIYRYRREELHTDWAVIIEVDSQGLVKEFAWNELSVLHPERLRPYNRKRRPTTRPASQPKPGDAFLGIGWGIISWRKGNDLYIGTLGVQVEHVLPGGSAEHAGLHSGDVIQAIDQQQTDAESFQQQLSRFRPGQTVTLTVLPAGKTAWTDLRQVPVTLDSRPAPQTAPTSGE